MTLALRQPTPTPRERPVPDRRRLSRLSLGFALDLVQIGRAGRHPLDTLILSAIIQANVAQISARADFQVTYACAADVPPDTLRRPVSINALASSLALPFETVRRRVRDLEATGLCVVREGGLVTPAAVLAAPAAVAASEAAYSRAARFHGDAAAAGLLPPLPPATVCLAAGDPPVRIVARLTSDYLLRLTADLAPLAGGPVAGLVLLQALAANTDHPLRPDAPTAPTERGEADPLAARRPRPVRAVELARRAGLPRETVRRHLAQLEARGLCQTERGGVIVPAAARTAPPLRLALSNNLAHLDRMFVALSRLGVLALWSLPQR